MVKVKICGLKTVSAVETAVLSGADYIGFVFAKSKRQISIAEAKHLSTYIPPHVKKVGVFVSPNLETLEEHIASVPLDMVQIHGVLPNNIREKVTIPIIQAFNGQMGKIGNVDFALIDSSKAGSGQLFDWKSVENFDDTIPFFIAGGLGPENVRHVIEHSHPYGVDVSSGVESQGQKDLCKIKQFIERAKYDI